MKDDRLYLIHIRECIERIEQYTLGGKDAFFADTKTQDAVLRVLQTLAESTQRIADPLKARHPEVDCEVSLLFGMSSFMAIYPSTSNESGISLRTTCQS